MTAKPPASTALLLEMSGHEVRTAFDGGTVLTLAREFAPDAAILDIRLPDMDGRELLKRLKDLSGFRNTTFIALTGYEEDDLAGSNGVADLHHILRKPVYTGKLEALLARGLA